MDHSSLRTFTEATIHNMQMALKYSDSVFFRLKHSELPLLLWHSLIDMMVPPSLSAVLSIFEGGPNTQVAAIKSQACSNLLGCSTHSIQTEEQPSQKYASLPCHVTRTGLSSKHLANIILVLKVIVLTTGNQHCDNHVGQMHRRNDHYRVHHHPRHLLPQHETTRSPASN